MSTGIACALMPFSGGGRYGGQEAPPTKSSFFSDLTAHNDVLSHPKLGSGSLFYRHQRDFYTWWPGRCSAHLFLTCASSHTFSSARARRKPAEPEQARMGTGTIVAKWRRLELLPCGAVSPRASASIGRRATPSCGFGAQRILLKSITPLPIPRNS